MVKSRSINQLNMPLRVIILLFTPFLAMLPNPEAQAFCNQNVPLSSILPQCPGNVGGHKDITTSGLTTSTTSGPFIRTEILNTIISANVGQDLGLNFFSPEVHFDESNFTGGVNYINGKYPIAIGSFDPTSPQPFNASEIFGQLLHPAQDFYSHSNWVDYNPTAVPLFDSGTASWTNLTPYTVINRGAGASARSLLLIQGTPIPAGTVLTVAPAATPPPARLITIAGHPSGATQGLVSGFFSLLAATPPADAPIRHGSDTAADDLTTLNKDNSTRTNYTPAFNTAVTQTENEWCRLLHLTAVRQGFGGSSIPMALWVDPSGNPHPSSTACSTTGTGRQSVQVSIKSIKVVNDTDFFGPGELNFPFVLYRKDFTKSVRTEVNSISVASGNFVPPTVLPAPLTLDLDDLNDLVITLQAWDDDNLSSSLDGILDSSDDVLKGITDFFPGKLQRKVNQVIPGGVKSDLEVCLEIKVLGNLAPQQVESEGCLDFGDAPDSYKTLLESDGPRYQEGDSQRLGFQWDDEWDGQPTPLADGDDQSIDCSCSGDTDDEDGVIFGDSWVDVIFRLNRPANAIYNLSAWWDLDNSHFFEHPSERKIFDNFTIADLVLIDPENNLYRKRYDNLGFDPRKYFSRFRLTWNLTTEVLPWGVVVSNDGVSHGEVEDYAPVPEPSSIFGLFTLAGLGLTRLRQKGSD